METTKLQKLQKLTQEEVQEAIKKAVEVTDAKFDAENFDKKAYEKVLSRIQELLQLDDILDAVIPGYDFESIKFDLETHRVLNLEEALDEFISEFSEIKVYQVLKYDLAPGERFYGIRAVCKETPERI